MRSRRLRLAALAFLTILTMDLVDGPPTGVSAQASPANGRPSVQADGRIAPDAEYFCERATVSPTFVLPVSHPAPEPLVGPRSFRIAHGFVPPHFHPPRTVR